MSSLSVENLAPVVGIKEMVDNGLAQVPLLYVRPVHDRPSAASVSDDQQIPVIDMAGIDSPNSRSKILAELGRACENWGFFQVINHGIHPHVIENLRAAAQKFFQQPSEERMRYHSQSFRASVGYSTSFNPSLEKVRDWRDTLSFNRFPGECDGFQEAPDICKQPLQEYIAGVEKLAGTLYKAIFDSLGLDDKYLEAALPGIPRVLMGINYYPPCPDPSLTLGLSGHSDVSCLTILQPDEVPGLQVRKGATWVVVKPIKDAFVVNLADQTEILTNGRYKSIEHRVVTNTEKPRMSIACFFGPAEDTIIAPLSELIDEKTNPPRYKPTRFGDYVKNFTTNRLLSNRGTLDFARV